MKKIIAVLLFATSSVSAFAQLNETVKTELCTTINKLLKSWPLDYRVNVNKAIAVDTTARFYSTSFSTASLPVVLQLVSRSDPGRIYLLTAGNNNNMLAYFEAVKKCLPGLPADWKEISHSNLRGYRRADGCIVVVAYDNSRNKVLVEIASGYKPTGKEKLPLIQYNKLDLIPRSYAMLLFPALGKTTNGTNENAPKLSLAGTTYASLGKLVASSPNRYAEIKGSPRSNDVYNTDIVFWDFPERYVWTQNGGACQYSTSSRWFSTKDSAIQTFNTIVAALKTGFGFPGTFKEEPYVYRQEWLFLNKLDADKKPYTLMMRLYLGQRPNGDWNITFYCSNDYKK